MRKFSKAQAQAVSDAIDACGEAATALEKAVSNYNTEMESLKTAVSDAVETYNEKVGLLKGVYEEIGSEARDYYDERSEKWQEGDAGATYLEWVEALENPDLDEIDFTEPDEIDIDVPDFSSMDGLPPDEPGM